MYWVCLNFNSKYFNNNMFINIITPCIRPENLNIISQHINIPRENYRWIVVFDMNEFPDSSLIPENCEYYKIKDSNSISGNAQRNLAIDKVETGWLYFHDDDTTLHPELWNNVKDLNNDFISFDQRWPVEGEHIRLKGDIIKVCHTDSNNFLVHKDLVSDIRWKLDIYEADGYFAEDCYRNSKSHIYIPKVLATFNTLDKTRWYRP
jgi:hypothetical protein